MRAIPQNPPAPVRTASEIDRVNVKIILIGIERSDQRLKEIGAACHRRSGNGTIANQIAGPVKIAKDRFHQIGALDHTGSNRLPFGRADEQRQVTERPRGLPRVLGG